MISSIPYTNNVQTNLLDLHWFNHCEFRSDENEGVPHSL